MYPNNFENQMYNLNTNNNGAMQIGFNNVGYDYSFNGMIYPYQQNNVVLTENEYYEQNIKNLEKQEKFLNKRIVYEQKFWEVDKMKYSREQKEIYTERLKIDAHYNDDAYLKSLGVNLGKLGFEDKYIVKIKNDKPIIGSKEEIEKVISEFTHKKTTINDDIHEIDKISYLESNLISYLIPRVKVLFRPDLYDNIFINEDRELCFNSYSASKLMLKKYIQDNKEIYKSAIEEFILNISKTEGDYLLNLIGSHYQRTIKRPIAIALKGDPNTIKILILMLKEFFGSNYINTVNDKKFKESNLSELLKEKLIVHVDNISEETANSDSFQDFICKAIIDNKLKSIDSEDNLLFGLTFITSDSLDTIIKDCHSKVSIIEVNDFDLILAKMNVEDKGSLLNLIECDFDNFGNILARNNFNEEKAHLIVKAKINTMEENIKEFINDLATNPKILMSKLEKKNSALYEMFKNGYDKHNGVKQSMILKYFTLIYGQNNYSKNADFLEILKESPNFFSEKPEPKAEGKYYIFINEQS